MLSGCWRPSGCGAHASPSRDSHNDLRTRTYSGRPRLQHSAMAGRKELRGIRAFGPSADAY